MAKANESTREDNSKRREGKTKKPRKNILFFSSERERERDPHHLNPINEIIRERNLITQKQDSAIKEDETRRRRKKKHCTNTQIRPDQPADCAHARRSNGKQSERRKKIETVGWREKKAKLVYHRVYKRNMHWSNRHEMDGSARAQRKIWVNKEVRCLQIPISKCDGSFPRSLTSDDWRYFVSDVSFAVISSDCYLQTLVSLSSLSIPSGMVHTTYAQNTSQFLFRFSCCHFRCWACVWVRACVCVCLSRDAFFILIIVGCLSVHRRFACGSIQRFM